LRRRESSMTSSSNEVPILKVRTSDDSFLRSATVLVLDRVSSDLTSGFARGDLVGGIVIEDTIPRSKLVVEANHSMRGPVETATDPGYCLENGRNFGAFGIRASCLFLP